MVSSPSRWKRMPSLMQHARTAGKRNPAFLRHRLAQNRHSARSCAVVFHPAEVVFKEVGKPFASHHVLYACRAAGDQKWKRAMSDDDIILAELSDEELVQQMHDDLYDGWKEEIEEATQILLDRGWIPYDVLTKALVEGMRLAGIVFRDGIPFVPEVLLSADAMMAGMTILRPLLAATG